MDEYAPPCPICCETIRDEADARLNGYSVCKRCQHRFASRRQFAFAFDFFWLLILLLVLKTYSERYFPGSANPLWTVWLPMLVGSSLLFAMKDGIRGCSLGKLLWGVRVVDGETLVPIGFVQSLRRNAPIAFLIVLSGMYPALPLVICIIGAGGLVRIGGTLLEGPRFGDWFAGTRVIWRQYSGSEVFGPWSPQCENCGYDLRAILGSVCPGCGGAIPGG